MASLKFLMGLDLPLLSFFLRAYSWQHALDNEDLSGYLGCTKFVSALIWLAFLSFLSGETLVPFLF